MLSVSFSKANLYQYVTLLTSQTGISKGDYDRFVCLPDNYPALDRHLDAAITELENSLLHHLGSSHRFDLSYTESEDTISLSIQDSRLDPRLTGLLQSTILFSLAYMLAFMWMRDIDPEVSSSLADQSSSYLTDAVHIIIQRSPLSDAQYNQAAATDTPVRPIGQSTGSSAAQDTIALHGESQSERSASSQDTIALQSGSAPSSRPAIIDDIVERPTHRHCSHGSYSARHALPHQGNCPRHALPPHHLRH